MSLALPALDEISQAEVDDAKAELFQLLAEGFPGVDLTHGFVHDINLHLGAVVTALLRRLVERVADSQSLLLIEQDPALKDTDVVDQVLANLRITRRAGAKAAGRVTVVISALTPLVVPAGTTFTANGAAFATAQSYAVRTSSASVTSADDLVLSPLGDGRYAFSVAATAAEIGVAGMVRRGTAMTPTFAVPHLSQAYAEGDFTGGADGETNEELLARADQGIAAPTFSGRGNVDALVRQQAAFAGVLNLSIVGAGDAEMLRDKHTIFPIAQFGRADVYARTAALPAAVALTKAATYVGPSPDGLGGVWQLALDRGDAPGFYEVSRVALPSTQPVQAGFAVTADIRGVDLSGDGWRPDVVDAVEGAYSPYQTAVIRFVDTATALTGLVAGTSTADYAVAAAAMPLLGDLQDFLAGRGVRPYGGDVLVKAPVPCFLRVTFEVLRPALSPEPDLAAIAAEVARTVNNLGFAGRLHSSTLVAAVDDLLPAGAALSAIDVYGRIRRPDGTQAYLRDRFSTAVEVPDEPQSMVTGRTVVFILDPADVAVSSRVVEVPSV